MHVRTIPCLGAGWSPREGILLGTAPVATGRNTSWRAISDANVALLEFDRPAVVKDVPEMLSPVLVQGVGVSET